MAKATKTEENCSCSWDQDIAYKLVELYVTELTERKDKKILDIEGLVEAYLYVWGRLKTGEQEMGSIVAAIKDDLRLQPEGPNQSGMDDAVGKKKLSEGLLKALEGM